MAKPHMLDFLPPIDGPRFEIKLGVPATQRYEVIRWLMSRGLSTLYPRRRVNSAYFDTHMFDGLHSADAGIADRVKPRVRWYGDTLCPEVLRFEAKCKRASAGYKRIASIKGPIDFGSLTWTQVHRAVREQLDGPLGMLFDTAAQAAACTRYDRDYFTTRDEVVRITLDNNVQLFPQFSMRPQLHRPVILDPLLIIEVKAAIEARDTVAWLLKDAPGRPSRLSKYGLALDPQRS